MTSDDTTTARRKAMAEQPRKCGNCCWFDHDSFECQWEIRFSAPVWITRGPFIKRMNPEYDARMCESWGLAEAADVAAEATRKEVP